MTINKAIATNQDMVDIVPRTLSLEEVEAVKLGIEALKREQHYRTLNQPCFTRPLTGETTE